MTASKLNYKFDEIEKEAIKNRLRVLIGKYELIEAEKILYSELDELGLRSEYYLKTTNEVIDELLKERESSYDQV